MRKELPVEIINEMKLWRLGLESFPKSYIQFHKELAEKEIENLKKQNVIVHRTYMNSDGWCDGMRVLFAIIEVNNELMKIHWHDGNQEFFRESVSGGSFPFRLSELSKKKDI